MDAAHARTVAERLHGGTLLAHIRRVVAATPPEARTVAWLHEALETGAVSEQALLIDGLSSDELRAIRLLTARVPARSDAAYLAQLELVARADGRSGALARLVKIADLRDRRRNPRRRTDGWAPPYALGLRRLLAADQAFPGGHAEPRVDVPGRNG